MQPKRIQPVAALSFDLLMHGIANRRLALSSLALRATAAPQDEVSGPGDKEDAFVTHLHCSEGPSTSFSSSNCASGALQPREWRKGGNRIRQREWGPALDCSLGVPPISASPLADSWTMRHFGSGGSIWSKETLDDGKVVQAPPTTDSDAVIEETGLGEELKDAGSATMDEKAAQSKPQIKISLEAKKMFDRIWKQVETKLEGKSKLHIPKEIVWLNGAPGAGKGANTPFILKTRGFAAAKAIQISDLLDENPETIAIMRSGGLVQDSTVLELLLETALSAGTQQTDNGSGGEEPATVAGGVTSGVVVDGFPRTKLQVDFVKLLYDKLMDLHYRYLDTPLEQHFPRPIFRIAVLYVEEEESVRRQLARGKAAITHNQRVRDSGIGDVRQVRPTDLTAKSARRRYQIFREHYDTLLRLKAFFPFHLIDAMGTLDECRDQIGEELQYQSALELDETTFHAISHIPLAHDIAQSARQAMVARLDNYEKHDHECFKAAIHVIDSEILPIIRQRALSGMAFFNTDNELFQRYPVAAEMVADILSERGYYVTWQTKGEEVPEAVDLKTGKVRCKQLQRLSFRIKFERPLIRTAAEHSHEDTHVYDHVPAQVSEEGDEDSPKKSWLSTLGFRR